MVKDVHIRSVYNKKADCYHIVIRGVVKQEFRKNHDSRFYTILEWNGESRLLWLGWIHGIKPRNLKLTDGDKNFLTWRMPSQIAPRQIGCKNEFEMILGLFYFRCMWKWLDGYIFFEGDMPTAFSTPQRPGDFFIECHSGESTMGLNTREPETYLLTHPINKATPKALLKICLRH